MNNIQLNPFFIFLIVVAVLAWIIYRQLRPRPLHVKGLVVIPLIIAYFIVRSLPSFHPTTTQSFDILLTSIISLILGLLACRSLHVYASKTTGNAMARGSWTYFLWWLASFVIKSVVAIVLGETSVRTINITEILLPVFFLISTRNAYLYWKAMSLGLTLHPSKRSK